MSRPAGETWFPLFPDPTAVRFAVINAASSGNNIIVPAAEDLKIKVLSYTFVVEGDVAVTWKSGSSIISGEMAYLANSGISTAVGTSYFGWLIETGIEQDLILTLGSAVGVRGHLSYFLDT